ncbi:uncharacterized protein LOC114883121 isoform X2 [Osmia bicornis bicornis]|uniref:uncharacterized protein LOC114883121 isoform X2 n=1 Tax=Osmia bicornis bicornis TaxID=1437191 RepID=UPI001EAF2AEA|nr:uncharacterized protein LOC114883121 isoform X2 [Osmia bicornis bicornis]
MMVISTSGRNIGIVTSIIIHHFEVQRFPRQRARASDGGYRPMRTGPSPSIVSLLVTAEVERWESAAGETHDEGQLPRNSRKDPPSATNVLRLMVGPSLLRRQFSRCGMQYVDIMQQCRKYAANMCICLHVDTYHIDRHNKREYAICQFAPYFGICLSVSLEAEYRE